MTRLGGISPIPIESNTDQPMNEVAIIFNTHVVLVQFGEAVERSVMQGSSFLSGGAVSGQPKAYGTPLQEKDNF
jgi:hypothetical protein